MLSNGKIFPLNNMGNQFFGENGQSGCLIELDWSLIDPIERKTLYTT